MPSSRQSLFAVLAVALATASGASDTAAAAVPATKLRNPAGRRALMSFSTSYCNCAKGYEGSNPNYWSNPCPPNDAGQYCQECYIGPPGVKTESCPPTFNPTETCTATACGRYSTATDWSSVTRPGNRAYEKGSCGWFRSSTWWKVWTWYKGCDSGYSCSSGTCRDDTRYVGDDCSESSKCKSGPNSDTYTVCWRDSKCHRATDGEVQFRDTVCSWADNANPFSESPCHQHWCVLSTGDGSWKCDWLS